MKQTVKSTPPSRLGGDPDTAAKTLTANAVEAEPVKLLRRIGSTTYEVAVHFSASSTETLDDKIFRLIGRDMSALNHAKPLQTVLPERSIL